MAGDLFRNALVAVCDAADAYLRSVDDRGDAWVVLTSLTGHDGGANIAARDRVVMSVHGITREVANGTFNRVQSTGAPSAPGAIVAPPLHLDVHLMFVANFAEANYADGLAALSRLVSCFQQRPALTHADTPTLDPAIDRLTVEFENLSPADVGHIVSATGTRYLPTVFYRLRMLPFVGSAMQGRSYPVAATGAVA